MTETRIRRGSFFSWSNPIRCFNLHPIRSI